MKHVYFILLAALFAACAHTPDAGDEIVSTTPRVCENPTLIRYDSTEVDLDYYFTCQASLEETNNAFALLDMPFELSQVPATDGCVAQLRYKDEVVFEQDEEDQWFVSTVSVHREQNPPLYLVHVIQSADWGVNLDPECYFVVIQGNRIRITEHINENYDTLSPDAMLKEAKKHLKIQ